MLQALRRPPWRVSAGKAVQKQLHICVTAFNLWWCLVMELFYMFNLMFGEWFVQAIVAVCSN